MSYRRRRKRINHLLRIVLSVFLFLLGVSLLLLDPIKNEIIKEGQKVNSISNLSREDIISNQNKVVTYDFEDINPINALNVILREKNAEDLPVVGAIAIPNVDLNLPIYLGVSEEGMYMGAGTLVEGQQMGVGNYSLASHHSKHRGLLFEPLMRVSKGDLIYLTDLDKVYTYEVDFIEVVDKYRLDLLENNGNDIVTLITCNYDLVDRVAVRGTLVSVNTLDKSEEEAVLAFGLDYTVPD